MLRLRVAALLVCLLVTGSARAASDATLFRLFLNDGSSLVSFGEYARVADRIVFSMPVGGPEDEPRLHVVTLPASLVDWPRTERYADAARYARYADTRGEADFLQLTEEVARVLNEIAQNTDRSRALAYAEQARRTLIEWSRTHYGYRGRDVREIVMLLDESISDLRAALGVSSFDLALVAQPGEPSREPLLGPPSLREQIDQAFRVAALADRSSERSALLQAALAMILEAGARLPAKELTRLRRDAEVQLEEEQRLDVRYAQLTRRMVSEAAKAAERLDIRRIEQVIAKLPKEDARLGRKRPEAVASLHSSLTEELDSARRLQLLRDRWSIRRLLYRDYYRTVAAQFDQLRRLQPALESIRRQDGPEPTSLVTLRASLRRGGELLQRVQPAGDLQELHGMLIGSWRFAENALSTRYDAVTSGSVDTARVASSAAAGALLLLARAQQEARALLEPPRLR